MKIENQSVKDLERKIEMRNLVQTILDYGVNNNDIKNIIYFLALELEEPNLVMSIPQLINQSQDSGIIIGD
jgi:hypothetical protein